MILQRPTFIQIRDWLEKNSTPSTPIAFSKGRFFDYVPSREALDIMRSVNPNFYREASQYINYGSYPDNVINVIYTNEFDGETPVQKLDRALSEHRVVYVIDNYWDPRDRVFGKTKTNLELVETISPATFFQNPNKK